MAYTAHSASPCPPEKLVVFEYGLYCNVCGRPVAHFAGAGKADVTQALLLHDQTPSITVSQTGAGPQLPHSYGI